MKILVLDTIHGGTIIGSAFESAGCDVDMVDVYRNTGRVDAGTAQKKSYDLVIAPVHLDSGHPLVRSQQAPVISHHEAVRMLLSHAVPHPMIEITGTRGKTTTAHALAGLMQGPGVLLSSRGLFKFPEQKNLGRLSITPASVLPAARVAVAEGGWLIAEESLGVTGAGDLAILTSGGTYRCASGTRDALEQKIRSLRSGKRVLLPPGITCDIPGAIHVGDVAAVEGTLCRIAAEDAAGSFTSPLLTQEAYRVPLMLAGAAACLLGLDPAGLCEFSGVEGRMAVSREGDLLIVDNANSGTSGENTVAAARLARQKAGCDDLTLVIGTEAGDGKVCEGFPDPEIVDAISTIRPSRLVLVGESCNPLVLEPDIIAGMFIHRAPTLASGREAAVSATGAGSVVLAVKTWR